MVDWRILTLCLFCSLGAVPNSVMSPFYPREAHRHQMGDTLIGIVFSMNALGFIISCPIVGKMLIPFGRRNSLVLGLSILTTTSSLFGVLPYIDNKLLFALVSLTLRLLQGIGCGCIETAAFAITSIVYKDSIEKNIAKIESSFGLSYFLGPIYGTIFFAIGGFGLPFHILAIVYFILALNVKRILSDEVDTITSQETVRKEVVNMRNFIKNPRFVFLLLAISMMSITFTVFDPVFATRIGEFNVSENTLGLFFCISAFTYFIMALVVGSFARKYEQLAFVTTGLAVLPIAYFFIGPSQFLHFPNKLFLIPIGQILIGLGGSLILIPMIPALLKSVNDEVPHTDESMAELKDKVAGAWNSMGGIGSVIGPILSGYLVSSQGFRSMCDILALCIIIFGVFFFKFTNALSVFQDIFSQKHNKEGLLLTKELDSISEKVNPEELLICSKSNKI